MKKIENATLAIPLVEEIPRASRPVIPGDERPGVGRLPILYRLVLAAGVLVLIGAGLYLTSGSAHQQPGLHEARSMKDSGEPPEAVTGTRSVSAPIPEDLLAVEGPVEPVPGPLASMSLPDFMVATSGEEFHAPGTRKDCGPFATPYKIHEWGVMGLEVGGPEEILADLGAGMPRFVKDVAPASGKRFHAPPTRKPILYFYPEKVAKVAFAPDVTVGLTGGEFRYFWPPGRLARPGQLFWRHNVFWGSRDEIDPSQARTVPEGHWMEIARRPEALWLRVGIMESGTRKVVRETERFLFYDGQVPYASPLQVDDESGGIRVRHVGTEAIHDLMLIENDAQGTKIGHLESLGAGKTSLLVSVRRPDPSSFLSRRLVEAGLFESEAEGLAEIWQKDFFKRPGRWMLWRLDLQTVDALIPLTLDPAPTSRVRVHLVFAPVLSGAPLRQTVARLVQGFLHDSLEVRNDAMQKLRALGPKISPYLIDHLGHENVEVSGRVRSLLDELGRPR